MKQKEDKRKKELCAFVQAELEKRSRERSRFELQWQLNINFYGQPVLRYSARGRKAVSAG